VTALRAVPSLSELDGETLLAIVGDSANLFWSAGSTVFELGSRADGLYIIVTGSVRVVDAVGAEVATMEAGNFFGELSLLGSGIRRHSVEAIEDSELMVVPKQHFELLMAENPALAASIRATAAKRADSTAADETE